MTTARIVPEPEEAVVSFTKRFGDEGPAYSYAALRIDGLWYLTGRRSPGPMEWLDMVAWIGDGPITVHAPARTLE